MAPASEHPPIQVLVVAHGSRNGAWTEGLRAWFSGFERDLGELVTVPVEAELSFLEISPPLFTDRLRAYAAGKRPLLIFPFFLTRSGHAGDEIPALAAEHLRSRGKWAICPPDGWESVLGRNAERRLRAMDLPPRSTVVVSGYGASAHDDEWHSLVSTMRDSSGIYAGETEWLWAPAGHFLSDARQPLRDAIRRAMSLGRPVGVLPLYLAVSSYQEELIPSVLAEFSDVDIRFRPDSILPDEELCLWAARTVAGRLPQFIMPELLSSSSNIKQESPHVV